MAPRFSIILLLSLAVYQPVFCQTTETEDDDIVDLSVSSEAELADRRQAETLSNQGYELLEAERFVEAERLFRRALALDSTSQMYYENLARALGGQQNAEAVAAVYARAQRQFPNDSDLYYYRGDALQKLKRYEKARQEYDQAIAVQEDHPGTQLLHLYYFNRGNTYLKERNYEAACQDYDQALQVNDFHYASYANRGFARYNLRDKKGACADWHKAQEAGYEAAQSYLSKYCQ